MGNPCSKDDANGPETGKPQTWSELGDQWVSVSHKWVTNTCSKDDAKPEPEGQTPLPVSPAKIEQERLISEAQESVIQDQKERMARRRKSIQMGDEEQQRRIQEAQENINAQETLRKENQEEALKQLDEEQTRRVTEEETEQQARIQKARRLSQVLTMATMNVIKCPQCNSFNWDGGMRQKEQHGWCDQCGKEQPRAERCLGCSYDLCHKCLYPEMTVTFLINLIEAKNLVVTGKKLFNKKSASSDPSCKFSYDGKEVARSKVIKKSLEPKWNENFSVRVVPQQFDTAVPLVIELFSGKTAMGEVRLEMSELLDNLNGKEAWHAVQPTPACTNAAGVVMLKISTFVEHVLKFSTFLEQNAPPAAPPSSPEVSTAATVPETTAPATLTETPVPGPEMAETPAPVTMTPAPEIEAETATPAPLAETVPAPAPETQN